MSAVSMVTDTKYPCWALASNSDWIMLAMNGSARLTAALRGMSRPTVSVRALARLRAAAWGA